MFLLVDSDRSGFVSFREFLDFFVVLSSRKSSYEFLNTSILWFHFLFVYCLTFPWKIFHPKMHARRCFFCFWFMCCKFLLSLAFRLWEFYLATFVMMPGPWDFFFVSLKGLIKIVFETKASHSGPDSHRIHVYTIEKKCLRANCILTYMYHNRIII